MQDVTLFISCLALALMLLGLVQKEWVRLEGITPEKPVSSSPWITSINSNRTKFNPTDKKKTWDLMAASVTLSIILSFILVFDYISMIPPIKGRYFIFAFISFLTGTSLFTAMILFHQELKKSFNTYYYDIKVTWIFHSTYVTIFLYLVCGILCILSHRESNKSSLDLFEEPPTPSPLRQPESIQTQTKDRKTMALFPSESSIEILGKRTPYPSRNLQTLSGIQTI